MQCDKLSHLYICGRVESGDVSGAGRFGKAGFGGYGKTRAVDKLMTNAICRHKSTPISHPH